jgi:hypothetical protein
MLIFERYKCYLCISKAGEGIGCVVHAFMRLNASLRLFT